MNKAIVMNLDFSSPSGCNSILQLLHDNEVKKKKDNIINNFCHEDQTKIKNCPKKADVRQINVVPIEQKKGSSSGKVNFQ